MSLSQGDVYVALWVYDSGFDIKQFLTVVESKPMESGLVSVNAASLAGDLQRAGHASIYGLYFDSGKANVKPESEAALKEIATLLQQDPRLTLYVVGHTDNQGTRRSTWTSPSGAPTQFWLTLTAKYGVATARLRALRDGPISVDAAGRVRLFHA